MSEILEVLHLADQHRMTKVEVRRGGIEPDLHDKGRASPRKPLELGPEVRGAHDIHAAPREICQLFIYRHGPVVCGKNGQPTRARWPWR
jgi:hypothetical protein